MPPFSSNPRPPPPAPPRQLKIHSAVLGEKKKQAIDALISYEGGLSSILARSSFHKS